MCFQQTKNGRWMAVLGWPLYRPAYRIRLDLATRWRWTPSSLSLIGSWITFSFLPRSAASEQTNQPDVIEPTNRKLIRPKYTTDSQVGQVKGPVASQRNFQIAIHGHLSAQEPWRLIFGQCWRWSFFWRIRYKILLKMTLFAAAAEPVTGFRRSFWRKTFQQSSHEERKKKKKHFHFFSTGRYQLKVWWRERTGFVIRTITGSPVREFAENDCLALRD